MNKISSIIPLRAYDFSFYKERLQLRAAMNLSQIETVLIDDGSPFSIGEEIKEFCDSVNFVYQRLETTKLPFSLSRARNAGIDAASNEWIVMEDADIIYENDFYNKIEKEVTLIDKTPFNFLTIPVIYLKEKISEQIFIDGNIDEYIPKILTHLQFEDPSGNDENEVVESYAPATALFVVRKKLINLVGGYDEHFVGWGGEDRDLAFRLIAFNKKIDEEILPDNFDATKSWNLNKTFDYEGWRSLYRLTGDYLANKGLYGFHLYHPKLEWREKTDTKKNIDFAKEKAVLFNKSKKIKPRFNKDEPVNIVIGYNPHIINDYFLSALENVTIFDDDRHSSYHKIIDQISNFHKVSAIYFWNPYGSDWRISLYKELKRLSYKVIVAERGALPNSFYFDDGGFCIESGSYKNFENLVNEFSEDYIENKASVEEYINNLRYGSSALEAQDDRMPVGMLRMRLGIDNDKKIIFCPLQLSTDTVTNYYVDLGRSYDNFLVEIDKLAAMLPDEWVFVVKNHPLSVQKFSSKNMIVADNYHINDLIEASSAVVLFNSGCGVLSMAFEKKVFYYGKCFYAIDGVNDKFISAEYVLDELSSGKILINRELVNKFYYFLNYHFYSFAEVENKVLKIAGGMKNVLKNIHFSSIKLPGRKLLQFDKPFAFNKSSLLLDRYGKAIYLKNNQPKKSEATAKPIVKVQDLPAILPEPVKKVSSSVSVSQREQNSIGLGIYKLIASPFLKKSKKNKLHSDPEAFFRDSSSKMNKVIGNIITK